MGCQCGHFGDRSCTNGQHTVASGQKKTLLTWIPRGVWTGSEGAFHLPSWWKMRMSIFDALTSTVILPSGYFVHGWKIRSVRCSMKKALFLIFLGHGHSKASHVLIYSWEIPAGHVWPKGTLPFQPDWCARRRHHRPCRWNMAIRDPG